MWRRCASRLGEGAPGLVGVAYPAATHPAMRGTAAQQRIIWQNIESLIHTLPDAVPRGLKPHYAALDHRKGNGNGRTGEYTELHVLFAQLFCKAKPVLKLKSIIYF